MITREDVIRNAEQYLNIQSWHPITDEHIFNAANPNHTFHSSFTVGEDDPVSQVCRLREYDVMPYVFGGFDTLTGFRSRINNQTCPGGWDRVSGNGTKHWYDPTPQGFGYLDGVPRNLAGIDCSGYVSRCWRIDRRTTRTLPNICLQIDRSSLKKGDILNWAGRHVRIFNNFRGTQVDIYEATGGGGRRPFRSSDEFGRVVHHRIDWDDRYIPYSPFPQFYSIEPAICPVRDSRPIFKMIIKSSGTLSIVDFVFNSTCISPHIRTWVRRGVNYTEVIYTPDYDLMPGTYCVYIKATNTIAGQIFQDKNTWSFEIEL